jgi:hypothetical protein
VNKIDTTIEENPMHYRPFMLPLLAAITACGNSTLPQSNPLGASPTQAQNLDLTCDKAAYPSAAWTQCEQQNFALQSVSLSEQQQAAFKQREQAQQASNIQDWSNRAASDPSWLDPRSGNTALLPACTTWGGPCMGDPFRYPSALGADGMAFYRDEASVTPFVFYDRQCARLSGRVWLPKQVTGTLPNVVITNGSVQASETLYWPFAQAMVRAGYAVMTYDPRGQGRSDQQSPNGQQGSNAGPQVFWEGQVDAIDFFRSTPSRPYPHNAPCAGTYPTAVAAHNPIWNRIDPARLGIAGHSLGASGVSVVQGYGAAGAAPWPGKLDSSNPVKVAVAWDSLINPDFTGLTPGDSSAFPPEVAAAIGRLVITQNGLPVFGARVPAMSFNADYALVTNVPYANPPDAERHKLTLTTWRKAGLPWFGVSLRGSTHLDFSPGPGLAATSWCPNPASGVCSGGLGVPAISYYTVAWLDRWLKLPNESGYTSADARLLDDGGSEGAVKLSYHYRSARDFPDRSGKRQGCESVRAGC